ncbi:metacaspase 2f, metacaspase 9 [Hibiscus trionum]|uniref:Metacaspase 2f, metacaspase 9 n=1 Tax=Hibiscus trionum TaxID=183268 RepID=A0A9W7JJJ0_HIBTR|nr:metacaspase 2f, metacaspase 9 [Hibiscus trionum]
MAKGTKRAVLVGCTYNKTRFSLYGCIKDVRKMNDFIVNQLGFCEENVKVLTDEPVSGITSAIPTGEKIREALSGMVDAAEAGDVLLFYFSGHGTAIPDYVPGLPYREEKAIVTCDLDLITGTQLRDLVDQLPGGATLTIVADSSYSGGLIVGGKEQIGSNAMIPFPTSYAKLVRKSIDFNVLRGIRSITSGLIPEAEVTDYCLSQDGGILLSGCDANETSFDVVLGGEAYGAFTNAVLKVLRNLKDCPANTRLVYEVRKKLKEDGIGVEQNPCLYCNDAYTNEPFLGGFANNLKSK